MSKILIKNIKELVQVETDPTDKVAGVEMKNLPTIKDAWLAIEDDLIVQPNGEPLNLMESIPIEADEIESLMNE